MTQAYPLYSNIILRKTDDNGELLRIQPFLETLIYKLAETHPEWTLEEDSGTWYQGRRYVGQFKVLVTATKELIGNVGIDTRRHSERGNEEVFSIHNDRLSKKRERGHSYKTTKLKDALKVINKEFYPRTIRERTDSAWQQAQWHIGHALRTSQHDLEDVQRNLGKIALGVVRQLHWDAFLNGLKDSPELAKKAMELDDLIEHHNQVELVHKNYSSKKLLTVIITGDKYTVVDNADIRTYTSDDLPEQVRQQVGLLKLVQEKEVVAGVGLRVGDLYLINAVI